MTVETGLTLGKPPPSRTAARLEPAGPAAPWLACAVHARTLWPLALLPGHCHFPVTLNQVPQPLLCLRSDPAAGPVSLEAVVTQFLRPVWARCQHPGSHYHVAGAAVHMADRAALSENCHLKSARASGNVTRSSLLSSSSCLMLSHIQKPVWDV